MPNTCGVVIHEWLAVTDTMELDKKRYQPGTRRSRCEFCEQGVQAAPCRLSLSERRDGHAYVPLCGLNGAALAKRRLVEI